MRNELRVFGSTNHIRTEADFNSLKKMHKVAVVTTSIALAALPISIVLISLPMIHATIPLAIIIGLLCLTNATSLYAQKSLSKRIISFVKNAHPADSTANIARLSTKKNPNLSNKARITSAMPTAHSKDTHRWRLRLINAAQHNVILSGNYCGEYAFDETLDLLEKKLAEKPEFTVVILSSPKFIKNKKNGYQNQKKIDELSRKYPERFSLVINDDHWIDTGNGIKKTTNHTKALVIDYGKYFILGGSGVKDNFAKEGVDQPHALKTSQCPSATKTLSQIFNQIQIILAPNILKLKESNETSYERTYIPTDHLENEDPLGIKKTKITPQKTDTTTPEELFKQLTELNKIIVNPKIKLKKKTRNAHALIQKILVLKQTYGDEHPTLFDELQKIQSHLEITMRNSISDTSMISKLVSGNFRDMDFVFKSDDLHPTGTNLFLQLLQLAHRWEHFNLNTHPGTPITPYDPSTVSQSAAFTNNEPTPPIYDLTYSLVDDTTDENTEVTSETVTERLLNQKAPKLSEIHTTIPEYDENPDVAKKASVRLLYSGPEQETSDFHKTILRGIERANDEILINHMYFNPTKELLRALAKAANRGVKITVITNGVHENSAQGEKVYGPN
ncbi:MAG: phospholipase D-like domain-containing protein, partial [Simkaniaceae bacterium]|nr:phospholipase D-like domain-containing protein [Simkaniaceae bacterium]